MREICTSGSTRGEWVALSASPSLLLYRLCNGAVRRMSGAATSEPCYFGTMLLRNRCHHRGPVVDFCRAKKWAEVCRSAP